MGAKQPAGLDRQLKGGGVLVGVADAVPDTVCDNVPVGVPLGVLVGVPDTVCDGVREGVPLSVLVRVPDTVCDGVREGVPLSVLVRESVFEGVSEDVREAVGVRVAVQLGGAFNARPATVHADAQAQGSQLAARAGEKVPMGHSVALTEDGGQKEPAGQAVHVEEEVAPTVALKVPAAQGTQAVARVTLDHVLAAHGVQAAAPAPLKVPTAHEVHCEALVAPCVPLKLPAAHSAQELFPAALQLPRAQHVPAPALENKPLPQAAQADAPAPE